MFHTLGKKKEKNKKNPLFARMKTLCISDICLTAIALKERVLIIRKLYHLHSLSETSSFRMKTYPFEVGEKSRTRIERDLSIHQCCGMKGLTFMRLLS